MADASRFPSLALPFAIVGGAAGWLSAGLLRNPLIGYRTSPPVAAAVATLVAVLAGAVIKRLCVGRRYQYELGEPNPDFRPTTDRWPLHALVVILGGAIAGAITAALCEDIRYVHGFAASGAGCSLVFLPVCLAVIAAARRAQRARLGSLVAASDRRAVWGILAMTLAATTLEALPDWPAFADGEAPAPILALAAVIAACAVTLGVLRADRRAIAAAQDAVQPGMRVRDPETQGELDPGVDRLDLGLGDMLIERVARGAAAYRDRARTLALVQGDPQHAMRALRRAARRGTISLAALLAIVVAHAAATASLVRLNYDDARCTNGDRHACAVAANLIGDRTSPRAVVLRWRAYEGW